MGGPPDRENRGKSTGQRYRIQCFRIMFPWFGHEVMKTLFFFFHFFPGICMKGTSENNCPMIPPVTQVEHGLLAEGALDDWGGRKVLRYGFMVPSNRISILNIEA